MDRRAFFHSSALGAAGCLFGQFASAAARGGRPNIVWITAEDIGPDMGCYGNPLVQTPNIDRMAREGVRFSNAFTTAPVCSASRSAFMTGMYQTSIGAHHHRSHREDGYRLPGGVHVITQYFRDRGYFTANVTTAAPGVKGTGKTDFNFAVDRPFDGNDWVQREPGQPFFAHVNFPETHRNFEPDPARPVDPDSVDLPPYYPDHPAVREDWALYLESIQNLDRKVGAVLRRLEEDGLADNTVVAFFGDHGRAHVRGKQWLYDGGIHIPLIVRFPDGSMADSVREDMVSAIDLTRSSLELAGIEAPGAMQGRQLFAPGREEREYIVAARDRCDETVDRIRCVRTKEYKYIKNFYPERPYTQLNRYKETQYPVLRLMRKLHELGRLTPEQARFMAPTRPPEELYDLRSDPHELHNLADDPARSGVLNRMRSILDEWIVETGDRGEIPEDPAIAERYEARMKANYDERLERIRERERDWVR